MPFREAYSSYHLYIPSISNLCDNKSILLPERRTILSPMHQRRILRIRLPWMKEYPSARCRGNSVWSSKNRGKGEGSLCPLPSGRIKFLFTVRRDSPKTLVFYLLISKTLKFRSSMRNLKHCQTLPQSIILSFLRCL